MHRVYKVVGDEVNVVLLLPVYRADGELAKNVYEVGIIGQAGDWREKNLVCHQNGKKKKAEFAAPLIERNRESRRSLLDSASFMVDISMKGSSRSCSYLS